MTTRPRRSATTNSRLNADLDNFEDDPSSDDTSSYIDNGSALRTQKRKRAPAKDSKDTSSSSEEEPLSHVKERNARAQATLHTRPAKRAKTLPQTKKLTVQTRARAHTCLCTHTHTSCTHHRHAPGRSLLVERCHATRVAVATVGTLSYWSRKRMVPCRRGHGKRDRVAQCALCGC